ncbi:hypothetical protein [Halomarina litorea]|uniref:hypothetical protein n=1 Tax=Halomarina litorea TaxID=2961595 RepID=UPI0020C2A8CE|nr:hypothetical protein [Halomarina sp. BCD28]
MEGIDGWTVWCLECEFEGMASREGLASRLAEAHRSASDHSVGYGTSGDVETLRFEPT